jgi:hypothetical protein
MRIVPERQDFAFYYVPENLGHGPELTHLGLA